MTSPIQSVRQGGSFDFVFDRSGASIDGWICTIHVKEFKGDSSVFSRVVVEDATLLDPGWSGFITSTESDTLTIGTLYRLVAILTNATTDEEEQQTIRFNLVKKWA